jgi:hypothetical protein
MEAGFIFIRASVVFEFLLVADFFQIGATGLGFGRNSMPVDFNPAYHYLVFKTI